MCGMRISMLGQESSVNGDELRVHAQEIRNTAFTWFWYYERQTSLKKLPASWPSAPHLLQQPAASNRFILLG